MSDEMDYIVSAYLAGEPLSTEERLKAEKWLQEHKEEKNVKLIEGMFTSGRLIQQTPEIRGQEAFRKIAKEAMQRLSRRKRKIRLYYSCSVAAVVILFCCIWVFLPRSPQQDSQMIAKNTPKTENTFKPHLKLSTGEIIELDKYQEQMIRKDCVQIQNTNNTLIYTSDSTPPVIMEYNTLSLPRGTEYSIMLADGTKVYLNAGSEIRYPVTFTGDYREVELKGEAYFEVARDEQRPFRVRLTDDVCVRVLGTSFNVTAYSTQQRVVTTLEEGHVQLEYEKQHVDITPGEQAIYDKGNGKVEVKRVDTKLYTSWRDGYYKFDSMTLEEIMETLTLWYDLNVFYSNPEVKSLEFTGRLKRYDNVEGLFRKLEDTGLVEFTLKGNNVTINKK